MSDETTTKVTGFCPMGCGPTLTLDHVGDVVCSDGQCPRPEAVAELLADRETEHIVELGAFDFVVQHPLRERLDGELFACSMHQEIASLDAPPEEPGHRYRVGAFDDPWARLS